MTTSSERKEISVLQRRRAEEDKKLDAVLHAINSALLQKQEIEKNLKIAERRYEETADRLEEYEKRREDYEAVLHDQNEKRRELISKISVLNKDKTKLEKDIDKLGDTMKKIEVDERKRIESALAGKKRELDKVSEDLTAEKASLQFTVDSIDTENKNYMELVEKTNALKESVKEYEKAKELNAKIIAEVGMDIASRKQQLADLTIAKEKLENTIEELNHELKGKTDEITTLDKGIATAKKEKIAADEEYEKSKTKLFSILERERRLNQKEVFIKNKYEEAGVEWRE